MTAHDAVPGPHPKSTCTDGSSPCGSVDDTGLRNSCLSISVHKASKCMQAYESVSDKVDWGYPFNRADVGWGGGSPSCRHALSEVRGRVPGLVPHRCGLHGLPGVACGLRLRGLRPRRRLGDGRYRCSGCGGRTSVTAGTIFDRTRTPLTVWFTASWLFAASKDGISALSLQRTLEIGSDQTAWALLHRLRSVLVRPGRDRLGGVVEVDETYSGGEEPGLAGGRARGKKVLTGIAVEIQAPNGVGRCRMLPLADASAASLHPFVTDHVAPHATVITDGWPGYSGLEKLGYVHDRRSQRAARAGGEDPGALLPAVHRVVSLAKRWLLGTRRAWNVLQRIAPGESRC